MNDAMVGRLRRDYRDMDREGKTMNSRQMAMQRRIEEMEANIGVKTCVDEITGKSII